MFILSVLLEFLSVMLACSETFGRRTVVLYLIYKGTVSQGIMGMELCSRSELRRKSRTKRVCGGAPGW